MDASSGICPCSEFWKRHFPGNAPSPWHEGTSERHTGSHSGIVVEYPMRLAQLRGVDPEKRLVAHKKKHNRLHESELDQHLRTRGEVFHGKVLLSKVQVFFLKRSL